MKIDEKFVWLDFEADTAEDALRTVCGELERAGYVKSGYGDAVVSREQMYPTGLPTQDAFVAVPHASGEYVNSSAIAVVVLKKPVAFGSMEDPEEQLPVNLFFLLALKEGTTHRDILQELMGLFQRPNLLRAICDADKKEQVCALLAGKTSYKKSRVISEKSGREMRKNQREANGRSCDCGRDERSM